MENMGERKETHSVWVQQIMFKPFYLWKMTGRGKEITDFWVNSSKIKVTVPFKNKMPYNCQ